jgi:putative hemolysin
MLIREELDTLATAHTPGRAADAPRAEIGDSKYAVRFAETAAEVDAVLKLRFDVFNLELGEGLESSFLTGRDEDGFDGSCHHLMVVERASGDVVGTYRLQTGVMAAEARGFYSAGEFDLSHLPAAVLADAVEVGRACIARAHRNTRVLFLLWKGLAAYLAHHRKRYFFGCCSLPSQDAREAQRVSRFLERGGHMHPGLAVPPRPGFECDEADADDAPPRIPPLFGIYLRYGAKVCSPPAIDRAFGTTDFFILFDADAMDRRTHRMFFGS